MLPRPFCSKYLHLGSGRSLVRLLGVTQPCEAFTLSAGKVTSGKVKNKYASFVRPGAGRLSMYPTAAERVKSPAKQGLACTGCRTGSWKPPGGRKRKVNLHSTNSVVPWPSEKFQEDEPGPGVRSRHGKTAPLARSSFQGAHAVPLGMLAAWPGSPLDRPALQLFRSRIYKHGFLSRGGRFSGATARDVLALL